MYCRPTFLLFLSFKYGSFFTNYISKKNYVTYPIKGTTLYRNWATILADPSSTTFWLLFRFFIICCIWDDISIIFFLVSLGGVRLSPLGTSATVSLLYQPRMIDDNDYGAVGGMRIGRGNRSTRRKPAPVPLCPLQIPHDLTWDRTRAAEVGNQRLTAWAMAGPEIILSTNSHTRHIKLLEHNKVLIVHDSVSKQNGLYLSIRNTAPLP
jgi:hypothetical protein